MFNRDYLEKLKQYVGKDIQLVESDNEVHIYLDSEIQYFLRKKEQKYILYVSERRKGTEEKIYKSGGNLFEKRENKENEMVIMNVAEQWLVYATDERASKITGSEKKFKTEEEALDNFITRLRALNVLKN